MPRSSRTGVRKLIYSTGQSNALGTLSYAPLLNPALVRVSQPGSPRGIGGNAANPDPASQLRFWNHDAFGDMYVLEDGAVINGTWLSTETNEGGGQSEINALHNHELGPGVMAVLKSWEWELDTVQNRWVAAAGGIGGTALASIGPGSAPYDEMLVDVTALRDSLPVVEQRQIEAVAICMTHGSADAALGTAQATYRAGLETLRGQWRDDINALTGRSDEPIMTVDMHSYEFGADTLSENQNAKAIHDAIRNITSAHSNIYNVGARPTLGMSTADGIHYLSWSQYQMLAEQHAKVIRRVTVDGDTSWKPLQFTTVTAQAGNIVRVGLEGGSGNAQLDTREQKQPVGFNDGQKYGFTYLDDGDARIARVDVRPTYIDIHLDAAPSTNPTLSHGWTSQYILAQAGGFPANQWGMGRIYVRDSESEYMSRAAGGDPIYSWLCPFILEPVV